MRDFKAKGDIYVDGNIVINDYSSQQHKPLVECNVDELESEYNHRNDLLEGERDEQKAISRTFMLIAASVSVVIAIWYMYLGESHWSMFIIGLIGVVIPFMASSNNEVTEFEQRQLDVLKEIEFLLRERSDS